MEQNAEIIKELHEISGVVSNLSKRNVYQVPDGYFDSLPQQILVKVHESILTGQHNLDATEEISAISPLLAGLKNKQVLSIPDGYFANLSDTLTTDIIKVDQKKSEAPVYSIGFGARKWIRYAAAAVVTGFIGICVYFFANNHSTNYKIVAHNDSPAVNSSLIEVSDAGLSDYLADLPDNLDTAIDSADAAFYNTAFLNINDQDLAGMIQEIPDADLFSYQDDLQIKPVSL